MSVVIEEKQDEICLILSGRFTSNSVYGLNSKIKEMLITYGIPNVTTIDIRKVIYFNASTLRALYYLTRFIYNNHKYCSFIGVSGITEDFLNLSGITFATPLFIIEEIQPSYKKIKTLDI